MSQETPNGFFYTVLSEPALVMCNEIKKITGQSVPEIISQAIKEYAERHGVKDAN
jgi:hypothetical protein